MGTKNNPGSYDCYQNAEPDEPMFVLLGRDPVAPVLVRLWSVLRAEMGSTSVEKIAEAEACAAAMEAWAVGLGKGEKIDLAKEAMLQVGIRIEERLSLDRADLARGRAERAERETKP